MKRNQFAHFWGIIKILKKFVFQILFWRLFFNVNERYCICTFSEKNIFENFENENFTVFALRKRTQIRRFF